jgi:syringomycin synthetase protein SyrE
MNFMALSEELGNRFSVHGLQARGLDGSLTPHSTVEAAARAYIPIVRDITSGRSAHLLGHSFGGWLAFEVAQQMAAGGFPVASLTLIDSEAPCRSAIESPEFTAADVFAEWIRVLELAAEQECDARDELMRRPRPGIAELELVNKWMIRVGLAPVRSHLEPICSSFRVFASALRTIYTPTRQYKDPTRLILVSEQSHDLGLGDADDPRVAQWRKLIPAVEVWKAPGNHVTVLKRPYVTQVATWWLNAVETTRAMRR